MNRDDMRDHKHLENGRALENAHSEKVDAPLCQSTHPALRDLDPTTRFLYTPHTCSVLAIGVIAILYCAEVLKPSSAVAATIAPQGQSIQNTKHGIWAAILVFLGEFTRFLVFPLGSWQTSLMPYAVWV